MAYKKIILAPENPAYKNLPFEFTKTINPGGGVSYSVHFKKDGKRDNIISRGATQPYEIIATIHEKLVLKKHGKGQKPCLLMIDMKTGQKAEEMPFGAKTIIFRSSGDAIFATHFSASGQTPNYSLEFNAKGFVGQVLSYPILGVKIYKNTDIGEKVAVEAAKRPIIKKNTAVNSNTGLTAAASTATTRRAAAIKNPPVLTEITAEQILNFLAKNPEVLTEVIQLYNNINKSPAEKSTKIEEGMINKIPLPTRPQNNECAESAPEDFIPVKVILQGLTIGGKIYNIMAGNTTILSQNLNTKARVLAGGKVLDIYGQDTRFGPAAKEHKIILGDKSVWRSGATHKYSKSEVYVINASEHEGGVKLKLSNQQTAYINKSLIEKAFTKPFRIIGGSRQNSK